MAAGKFAEELRQTCAAIAAPGKGILAADESTGTIGKRFASIELDNTEENRRVYRELLFCAPQPIETHISGVILFEETLYQKTKDGKLFVDVLKSRGIVPGIKVDKGIMNIPGTDEETFTTGLDGLDKKCQEYYKAGARFAKWRAVLKIDVAKGCPSDLSIQLNAQGLAQYAAICQANGLAPIVEPEVLSDGTHTIEQCWEATKKVQAACVQALHDHHVDFKGMMLKPNMVTPGSTSGQKVGAIDIAKFTVSCLMTTLPPAVPAVVFLSGGQGEEEATMNLNEMNKLSGEFKRPWSLTFSYGRALQASVLKAWQGKAENLKAGQENLWVRAKANGEANLGKYAGGAGGAAAASSLFEANYKY